ncbi:hypothetical protein ACFLRB_02235 [Acidobacteriota bacterium]
MDGFKFRERRERIEKIYDEVNTLIEEKSIGQANKKLKTTEKLLNDLTTEDLSEIQKRSTFNLGIRVKHLAEVAHKVEAKKK